MRLADAKLGVKVRCKVYGLPEFEGIIQRVILSKTKTDRPAAIVWVENPPLGWPYLGQDFAPLLDHLEIIE